ncbi:MAG: HAD family hydrolase [Caldisericia bacterium]
MLKVVSLDLWDTIIEDDLNLEDKRGEIRIKKLYEYLSPLNISIKEVSDAYNKMSEWLFSTQKETQKSINVSQQIYFIFKQFGTIPNSLVLEDIKMSYESAIFEVPPKIVDNVNYFLEKLKRLNLKLCILSDAGRTPGWALKEILNRYNLLHYFNKIFFSDEIGFVKPNKNSFNKIIKEFNVKKEEVVHIGDSIEKDIIGAKEFGINYIHFSRKNSEKIEPSGRSFEEIYDILTKNFIVETSLF